MICVSSSKSSCPACGADIQVQINLTEANSTKCESGEVACSPAETQVSLPRSPDREFISELKTLVMQRVYEEYRRAKTVGDIYNIERSRDAITQCLDKLDLGDVHSSPAKVQAKKKARSVTPKKAKK